MGGHFFLMHWKHCFIHFLAIKQIRSENGDLSKLIYLTSLKNFGAVMKALI